MSQIQQLTLIENAINCHNMDCGNIAAIIDKYTEKTPLQECWERFCLEKNIIDNTNCSEKYIIELLTNSQQENDNDNANPFQFIKYYCSEQVKQQLIPSLLQHLNKTRITTKILLSIECIVGIEGVVDDIITTIDEMFSRDDEQYALLDKDATIVTYLVLACGSYEQLQVLIKQQDIDWEIIKTTAFEFGLWFNSDYDVDDIIYLDNDLENDMEL